MCETGNGDYGTSTHSDRAQGTIAIVLAVLTDNILFSRRVIAIQKYAINMTVDKKRLTAKDGHLNVLSVTDLGSFRGFGQQGKEGKTS